MSTEATDTFDDRELYQVIIHGSAEDAHEFLGEGGLANDTYLDLS